MLGEEEQTLKRDVGWYGSFAMGYADVGADVYIALGLVALYAGGRAPVAFLVAAVTYVATGLAYAELATTYPYAGGAHIYSMKAFNDLAGFIAGWAVMLDYTVDIALFSLASAGYLTFFFPSIATSTVSFGLLAAGLVFFLLLLNIVGIRASSLFNEVLVGLDLIVESVVLTLSLVLNFNWNFFVQQVLTAGVNVPRVGIEYFLPNTAFSLQNFVYAMTIAMSSFIGIESIAQAAEETRKPHRWIPRANKLSIVFVLVFAMGLSIAGTGGVGASALSAPGNLNNPVTTMALAIPKVGPILAVIVAFTGFTICYVSTNTGVIGVSRVVFSMGRFRLLPRWFYKVHSKFRTPVRAVLIFGIIGAFLALPGDLPLVADLYNFGALLSYIMVNLSLIVLRNTDRGTYRAWKVPGELKLKLGEQQIHLPPISLLGMLSCLTIWLLIVIYHPAGRLLGAVWLLIGFVGFYAYRKRNSLPIFSKLSGNEIKPGGYVMNALALVRVPEDPEPVAEALKKSLDPRFELTLLNIIDPTSLQPEEARDRAYLDKLRGAAREELEDIAKIMRGMDFKCKVKVETGPLLDILRKEAESDENDAIILLKRKSTKGDIEKERIDSAYSILSKYPGKLMVVRRVEVRSRNRR